MPSVLTLTANVVPSGLLSVQLIDDAATVADISVTVKIALPFVLYPAGSPPIIISMIPSFPAWSKSVGNVPGLSHAYTALSLESFELKMLVDDV